MKKLTSIIVSLFFFSTVVLGAIINIPEDYETIQAGIDASTNGDTVLVQAGTYIENINFNGKNIVVGSLFLVTSDTSFISQTLIDGNQNGSVVTFENWEDSTTVLTGFTITNGYSNHGGGIWCDFSSPIIRHNIITGNQALQGGGIKCSASNLRIENNLFSWNSNWTGQISAGGGIYVWQSDVVISGNKFINNHSERHGGAIHIEQSNSMVINNIITGNNGGFVGGGICSIVGCTGNIINNLIYDNTAYSGGGIYLNEVIYQITNNTICQNSATSGGGIMCAGDAGMDIVNTILWNNVADSLGNQLFLYPCQAEFHYCDIQDGEDGFYVYGNTTYTYEDNIETDPQFMNSGEHPYSLSDGSECINAGSPDTSGLYLPEYDLAGNVRIIGDRIDIGAYEWQVPVYVENNLELKKPFILNQNFPNPFHSFTQISYTLNESGFVTLDVCDLQGRIIETLVNKFQYANRYSVFVDIKELEDGIYFYKLKVGNKFSETKKMIFIR